jgi:hypothetical protein
LDGKLRCREGYVSSFNGLYCIEDKQIERQANQMIETMKRLLDEQNGRFQCLEADTKGLSKAQIQSHKAIRKICKEEEFDLVWSGVLKLLNDPNSRGITVIHHPVTDEEFVSDGMILPFWCSLKWKASEYKFYILGLSLALLISIQILRQRRWTLYARQNAELLSQDVYRLLQKHKFHQQQNNSTETYIAGNDFILPFLCNTVDHLRDTILKPSMDKATRDQIWKQVLS